MSCKTKNCYFRNKRFFCGKHHRYGKRLFVLLLFGIIFFNFGFSGPCAMAGEPVLVKNIAWQQNGSGLCSRPVQVEDKIFFCGRSTDYGAELWKVDSDLNGAGMVKDIRTGINDSNPGNLTASDNLLFFTVWNGQADQELWRSDGTDAGTIRLKTAPVDYLMDVNGTLFFTSYDNNFHPQLWKSDGSVVGTVLVKTISNQGSFSSSDTFLDLHDILFFSVNTKTLWMSDGTEAGTVIIRDHQSQRIAHNPKHFTISNNLLFFTTFDSEYGNELWKSDGTAAGTAVIGQISSAARSFTDCNGILFFIATGESDNGQLCDALWKYDSITSSLIQIKTLHDWVWPTLAYKLEPMAETLYFIGANNGNAQLWKSDGTSEGTIIYKEIQDENADELISVNGSLFFTTFNADNIRKLRLSDGTSDGTVLLKNLGPKDSVYFPRNHLEKVNNLLFFLSDDGEHGRELWTSDGSVAGTVLVKDIFPGSEGSFPNDMTVINNMLMFSADNNSNGRELWMSDGSPGNTVMIQDVWNGDAGSFPEALAKMGNTLYFSADDGVHGRELWKTNEHGAGASLVKDINAGDGDADPEDLVVINNTLFFSAEDGQHGRELWRSDGTENGTVLVKDLYLGQQGSTPEGLTNSRGLLFFSAHDGLTGRRLWKSDGTSAGTTIVESTSQSGPFSPDSLISINGTLFFSGNDEQYNKELWSSDGTFEGTVMVKDIRPGNDGSYPIYLTNVNGTLFFSAETDTGRGIWKSDGSFSGTKKVLDGSTWFIPVDNTLFFLRGYSLWKLDCSHGETVLLKTFSQDSQLDHFTKSGNLLYFTNNDQLWRSDGTVAGTMDITPGDLNHYQKNLLDIHGRLYFTEQIDGNHSILWKSQGTGKSTAKESCGVFEEPDPQNFFLVDKTLYFTANDPKHGRELWKFECFQFGKKSFYVIPQKNGKNTVICL